MGTAANLELRLGGGTLYASGRLDGNQVYRALASFNTLLGKAGETAPTDAAYSSWFKTTASRVIGQNPEYSHFKFEPTTDAVCRVVIDPVNRRVEHNATRELTGEQDWKKVAAAIDSLKGRGYDVVARRSDSFPDAGFQNWDPEKK